MMRKKTKLSEDIPTKQFKEVETQYRCLDCDFTATIDNFNQVENDIVCFCCDSSRVVKVSNLEHLYDK